MHKRIAGKEINRKKQAKFNAKQVKNSFKLFGIRFAIIRECKVKGIDPEQCHDKII